MEQLIEKKKVYFLLEHLGGRGGVESVVTTVTKELDKIGYYTVVLLPNKSDDSSWESKIKNLYYYDSNIGSNIDNDLELVLGRVEGLKKVFEEIGYPDVIVGSHMPITILYSRLLLGYASKVKVISWIHSPLTLFGSTKRYLKDADIHWGISDNIIYELKDEVDENTLYKISNPILTDVKECSLVLENNFIYIGRLENYTKRLDILLNALNDTNIDWKLDIYGDGPDKDYIECIIRELNISDKVSLKGYVENPWDEIDNIKALLLSSDIESFSMVIAEALCRGIPVVSTNCAGAKEIIKDGYNGYLAETGNMNSLKEKIEILSELSNEELENLSVNGKNSIGDFSVEKVINRMDMTLKNIVNN